MPIFRKLAWVSLILLLPACSVGTPPSSDQVVPDVAEPTTTEETGSEFPFQRIVMSDPVRGWAVGADSSGGISLGTTEDE